jgi:hypothetical protein
VNAFFLTISSSLLNASGVKGDCRWNFEVVLISNGEGELPQNSPTHLPFCSSQNLHRLKTKLRALSPWANYTDRATAACRLSYCQLLRIEGATWSARLIRLPLKYSSSSVMRYSAHHMSCSSGIQPGVREDISGCTREHVTSINTQHRNRLNPDPALILALTNIRSWIEVQACQKQAQSSH